MRLMYVLLAVLLLGGVFAAGEWEDVNTGEENASVGVEDLIDVVGDYVPAAPVSDIPKKDGDGKFFTSDFYIALGVIVFVLIIVGIAVWFFLRGPINKWDRQDVLKKKDRNVVRKNIVQKERGKETSFWDRFKIKIKK